MYENYQLMKYISIINRQANRYYNKKLSATQIGCGQYFFLLRIQENEGISVLDLARTGYFDKGTTAKAIGKLSECGYIRVETDEKDRRVRRLYTTPAAAPVVEEIRRSRKNWVETLTEGIPPQELERSVALLRQMAEISYRYVNQMEMDEIESGTGSGTGTKPAGI